jgi:hypothetical protein
MANQFESFRESVINALREHCVKSKDGIVIFDWSMDKAFTACGEECKFENSSRLPSDFKDIVRFEFNKLKDAVMSKDGWTHEKTRTGYKFTIDGVEGTRSDVFTNKALPLDEQLKGARHLLDKCGKRLAAVAKDTKPYLALIKRQARLIREIDFLNAEIKRQETIRAEVNATVATPVAA